MKKPLLLVWLLACYMNVFSQEAQLTDEQQNEARTLVRNYYHYLQQWADNPNSDLDKNIFPLFSLGEGARVYDDLVTNNMTALNLYVNRYYELKDEGIKISLSEDINSVEVRGFTTEEIIKSKDAKVAVTVLTKQTKGSKIVKKAPNTFLINLEKKKIAKIEGEYQEFLSNLAQSANAYDTSATEANAEMLDNIFDGWYMNAILLYNVKKYEEALALFEKAAIRGHLKSQYEAGLMYFLKKGCGKLKKKERETRGYNWLIRAASQLPIESRDNKARQTLDALGYY
jgi:tetratricopeptide (TPR) repeat protein